MFSALLSAADIEVKTSSGISSSYSSAGVLNWDDAMSYCADYTVGQYDDWHLPSKDELNKLYENKTAIGGFTDDYYWSSKEFDSNNAWSQFFYYGNQYRLSKDITNYVRAVRAF